DLLLGPRLELADALLGDAQFAAELLERLRVRASKSVTADQDPALAGIEPAEHPLDDLLPMAGFALRLGDVAAGVGGGREELLVVSDETVAATPLRGDRAAEVLHDRPASVRAELEAPAGVELLDGADQRHVAVGDQLEEVVRRPDVLLGDRDDQPEIRP